MKQTTTTIDRGHDAPPPLDVTSVTYTPDETDVSARERFRLRFGVEPLYLARAKGMVWCGPVPEGAR
jgi:hypothetical protein